MIKIKSVLLLMIFKCRIIVLYWILLFFPCSAIWLLLKVTTMRTCSPKFPDIYAIESTFSKRQMAQSIEVENLCKNLFFKKILYKKYFLLIFFLILLYQNLLYKMKCKCLSKTFNLLKRNICYHLVALLATFIAIIS